jgi:nucleoside transporter
MSGSLRVRLAGLMFLQYFVMGLWAVTLGAFLMGSPHEGGLNMSARHVGLIYGTLAIGATVSPLFVGLLADRLFATQRVLAVLHMLGAGLLGVMAVYSTNRAAELHDQMLSLASSKTFLFENYEEYVSNALLEIEWRENSSTNAILWSEPFLTIRLFLGRIGFRSAAQLPGISPYWRLRISGFPRPAITYQDEYLSKLRRSVTPAVEQLRTDPLLVEGAERAFPPLFGLMLAYACSYLPTITLSNALTFRNLPAPAKQYGPIRALGTVGWVAAGLFVGFAAPAVSPLPFLYAAVSSALLAVLCLLLPHTPPAGKPKTLGDALGLPALRMLADRSFLVYVLVALAATALMPFHNSFTNKFLVDLHIEHAAAVQTLAQPTEIAGAMLIAWLWVRIGAKRMLLVGLLASAARFAAYASQSVPGILALGLPLHGVGFSLFYMAAALYVDRQAPPDLRASAQGLVTLVTLGAGGIAGNWFAGRVVEWHTARGTVNWGPVWLVPALGTFAAAGLFGVLFREPEKEEV